MKFTMLAVRLAQQHHTARHHAVVAAAPSVPHSAAKTAAPSPASAPETVPAVREDRRVCIIVLQSPGWCRYNDSFMRIYVLLAALPPRAQCYEGDGHACISILRPPALVTRLKSH
eukprot:TRINITY_DN12476_c0_g1_i1.p1 TRINITY_DN12476_c0_g1~~TRINITY_DN12476_c0_g1_i1.p1  ORF type:complete len:115 (-),score=15.76 TRINITY_DN12476_c0_g1_i1:48-392(-)